MMYAKPPPTLNALRLVVVVLAIGMVIGAGVAAALRVMDMVEPPPLPFSAETLAYVLGLGALGVAFALLLLPGFVLRSAAGRYRSAGTDAEREAVFLSVFGGLTLARSAFVEGLGILGIAFFLLTGLWLMLAAPALAAILLMGFFPADGKARAFRERLEMAPAL